MYATGRPSDVHSLTAQGKPFFTKKIGASAACNVAQVFCAHETIYQLLSASPCIRLCVLPIATRPSLCGQSRSFDQALHTEVLGLY